MQLLIIAGFLGAGKTSVLLPLAKALTRAGRRVAIIENEVGKVGVDNQTLQAEGLQVKELFSGCVCCSLRLDLITTLLELERTCAPDLVLLEPSGVAGPDAVAAAFDGYGGELERRSVAVVVDASRFETLFKLNLPIFVKGLEVADLVLVNKLDRVDAEALARIEANIRTLRPHVPVLAISALHGTNLDVAVARLLALGEPVPGAATAPVPRRPVATGAGARSPATRGPEPAVFAAEQELRFTVPLSAVELERRLATQLRALGAALPLAGATLVGHVKAIVRHPQVGYRMFSLTSFDGEVQVRGALRDGVCAVTCTLNAIVYGITPEALARLCEPVFAVTYAEVVRDGA